MSSENCRWYAVRTQPRSEERARHNLKTQGFEVFTPRVARTVRHARRVEWRLSPLFPGYTFVRLDASRQRWRPVDSTFGVSNIVKIGGTPAPLPVGLIEQMQSIADENGELTGLVEAIAVGDRVRVLGGPFDNWIGEVLALPERDRILLLIQMATRGVQINIAARAAVLVERAADRAPATGRRPKEPAE
jgi:transcription elongation factor/antiterminator RfaH